MDAVGEVLEKAKQAAIDYYRLTGKPLGITGEVGEYAAAQLLGLTLADARAPGYDATDATGRHYQIKTRALSQSARKQSQRLGSIKLDREWDAVLLTLLDERSRLKSGKPTELPSLKHCQRRGARLGMNVGHWQCPNSNRSARVSGPPNP